jgi:hypothetical protein
VGGTLTRLAHLPAELPAKLPAIRLPQGRMRMDPDGQKPQVKRQMDHRPTCLTRKSHWFNPSIAHHRYCRSRPGSSLRGTGLLGPQGVLTAKLTAIAREQPIHDGRSGLDDGAQLLPVDGLPDERAAMPDEPGHLLDGDATVGEQ